jgi:hypothetical protein
MDTKRLLDLFKPLSVLFSVWVGLFLFQQRLLISVQGMLELEGMETAMQRHFSALYWFDSDWITVSFVLCGILVFDFFDRRYENGFLLPILVFFGAIAGGTIQLLVEATGAFSEVHASIRQQPLLDHLWLHAGWATGAVAGFLLFRTKNKQLPRESHESGFWLLLFAVVGGGLGFAVQFGLDAAGLTSRIGETLVGYQGDTSTFGTENLVINWPVLFVYLHEYIGLGIGVIFGVAVYFWRFGEFRCDARLFLYMAVGWFIAFIALPVIGSLFLMEYGGLRMTPPRGDNWAGVLGCLLGALVYFFRKDLKPVALATVVCGTMGGIGFSAISWLKMMLLSFGHPHLPPSEAARQAWTEWQQSDLIAYTELVRGHGLCRTKATDAIPPDMTVPEFQNWQESLSAWQHYQNQNWHSFLEQSYGFVNGIGVAVALGFLVMRVGPLNNREHRRPWTQVLAVTLALPILTYLNMWKNLNEWTRYVEIKPDGRVIQKIQIALPETMKAPWIESIELSAMGWFNVFFWFAAAAMVLLLMRHTKRPLAIVPTSWLGRGQLLYFLLMWAFVLGNFTKALPGFGAGRLLTEGIILANAVLATVLILVLPRDQESLTLQTDKKFGGLFWGAVVLGLILAVAVPFAQTYTVRKVYGDAHAGHAGANIRFGAKANWLTKPILKNEKHR